MKIYIAPIAGYTDYSYRQILKKHNPDFLFTEMVNAHLLEIEDDTTINTLLKTDDYNSTGTQVFGHDKNEIINSFIKLEQIGFNHINLNLGCPQPKIIKTGAGSALLPKTDFIDNLIYEIKCKLKSNTKISLKIRIGYKDFNNPEFYLQLANKYNLDFICIHGRTQQQMYGGSANWDIIKNLSHIDRNVDFIGNGDLLEINQIINNISNCNLDGIMLARGILGNPWLINQCKNYFDNKSNFSLPSFDEIKSTLLEHFLLLSEHKGEISATLEINKFIKLYFQNFINYSNSNFDTLLYEIIKEKNYSNKLNKIKNI